MTKVALSIAGSDSGGGAGIQADIKTISALGVYPCTVITTITAQNTSGVNHILPLDSKIIEKQVDAILNDITIHAIKIGMVYNREIINSVYRSIQNVKVPIVLDPILVSGTGSTLLPEEFLDDFKVRLVPICDLITPNIYEAEKLSGISIKNQSDVIEAASIILKLGVKNIVIKGGHFKDSRAVLDFFIEKNGNQIITKNPRIKIKETHGSGCNFSSAITAFLANGCSMKDASLMASRYVHKHIMRTIIIGNGIPVNNPISSIYEEACRYNVINELTASIQDLMEIKSFEKLIPETQTNLVFAIPFAKKISEVAGVEGRIVKTSRSFIHSSMITFGASKHVASAVLAYMKNNIFMRSAINIKLNQSLLQICMSLFTTSEYDRSKEPQKIKEKEGMSIQWGINQALERNPKADVIYHRGDHGKEPMILVFGEDPSMVLHKIKKIHSRYRNY